MIFETIMLSSAVVFTGARNGLELPIKCTAYQEIVASTETKHGEYLPTINFYLPGQREILLRKLIGLCEDGIVRWMKKP